MKLKGFQGPDREFTPNVDPEAWRLTPFIKYLPETLQPGQALEAQETDITLMGAKAFIGKLPDGVTVAAGANAPALFADDLSRLPLAHAQVVTLQISKSLKRPLRIKTVRLSEGAHATMAALLIEVKTNVSCAILQECHGGAEGNTFQYVQLQAESGAQVDHAVIVREGDEAMHLSTFEYRLQEAAQLRQTVLATGGKYGRLQLGVALAGVNAHAQLASLNALEGKTHMDLHSFIRHEVGHTESVQKAKNFLGGEAKGVFTGRIHIAPQAQQVNAQQMNRNLLLSKKAHAFGQPQLEIYADDVKCAHGSSTGRVEEEAGFYLESRGIPPARAQELLSEAFVQEVLNNPHHPDLSQALKQAFKARS